MTITTLRASQDQRRPRIGAAHDAVNQTPGLYPPG